MRRIACSREGYLAENFVDGPLVEAMRLGGFLYIEELNRSPQDTLNTLLSAIGDRQLTIPRIGTITAKSTFRLIASMNPFDNVGTMRISMSIYDRLCRLAVGYQDEALEREIVEQRAGSDGAPAPPRRPGGADAVALVRATRDHPDYVTAAACEARSTPCWWPLSSVAPGRSSSTSPGPSVARAWHTGH